MSTSILSEPRQGSAEMELPDQVIKRISTIATRHLTEPRFDSDWSELRDVGLEVCAKIYKELGEGALDAIEKKGLNGYDVHLLMQKLCLDASGIYAYLSKSETSDVLRILRAIPRSSVFEQPVAVDPDYDPDDDRDDHARNRWPNG